MKIILNEDVKSLGKKGDIVNVSDGYARNHIIPRKLGVEATKHNLNMLKRQNAAKAKEEEEILEQAKELAKKIEGIKVKMEPKTGEGGKAFGSITTMEIASSVKEQFKLDLDRKKIQLQDPIKSAGTYNVSIKLHPQVTAELAVEVVTV